MTAQQTRSQSRRKKNTCSVCKAAIKLMCRTGTGICSENCDKKNKNHQFAIAA